MNLLGAVTVIVGFASLVYFFGLVDRTKQAIAISRKAMETMGNSQMTDLEKERFLQSSSLRLFKLLGQLVIGSIGALIIPFGVVWAAQLGGLVTLDAVTAILLRWDFIVAASVVGVVVYFALDKWSQGN
jgi:hypothetical protein